MSVAVVITQVQEARSLLHWAALVGRARGRDVVVFFAEPTAGQAGSIVELETGADPDPAGATKAVLEAVAIVEKTLADLPRGEGAEIHEPTFTLLKIEGRPPIRSIFDELRARQAKLLIVGRRRPPDADAAELALSLQLFRHAPCHAVMLRPGGDEAETAEHMLVPSAGGPHARVALELAGDLAVASGGDVTVLYVQTEVGDDAEAVGLKQLERTLGRAPSRLKDRLHAKVVLAASVLEGIVGEAPGYDLVLLGTSDQPFVKRLLFRTVSEPLLAGPEGTSVGVFRRSVPLPRRLERAVVRLVERTVPQLGRPDRVALVETLQSSSRWNFDFVFLMCLSTFIAALGLVADNLAVVIGAMLVAPLMTPLIGAGLALVQANFVLLRRTLRTVAGGFFVALVIGCLVGWITGLELTTAIEDRTAPGPIDLAVAFASGMAAAYALGRPGLSAALPGVAIAASLVPPIAAAGLCLVIGRPSLAAGAALLFFTNLVAIVLGASLSLYAAGVRSQHLHRRQKPGVRTLVLLMFVAAAIAAVLLSFGLAAVTR